MKRTLSSHNPRMRIFLPQLPGGSLGVLVLYFLVLRMQSCVGRSLEPVATAGSRYFAHYWLCSIWPVMQSQEERVALQQYQAKHGLPSTGELDEATRKALRVP